MLRNESKPHPSATSPHRQTHLGHGGILFQESRFDLLIASLAVVDVDVDGDGHVEVDITNAHLELETS